MANASDYPLPDSAAYIWTNGDKIFMTFPGYRGNEDRRFNTVVLEPKLKTKKTQKCKCPECKTEHEVEVEVKNPILEILWDVIKNRANSHGDERKIGTRSTPTQYDLDQMLKGMKATRIEPKKSLKGKSVAEMIQALKL